MKCRERLSANNHWPQLGLLIVVQRSSRCQLCGVKTWHARLPHGMFAYQKYQFGYILEGLEMKNVGIFYSHFDLIFGTF
jgi:hypothetical protein